MSGCLEAASKIVDAIKSTVLLTDNTQITLFLGPCNMYRRFIKAFFRNARPSNHFLRKDRGLNWPILMTEAREYLNTLKSELVKPLLFTLLQPHRPCMIGRNASVYAFESVPL